MKPTCLILVDALEFSKAESMESLRAFSSVAPMRPGFGFSVNLDAELFAGLTPDEAGYFNEWNFDPAGSPFGEMGGWARLLDALGGWYHANRVMHKLHSAVFGTPSANIPFSQVHLFRPFKTAIWDPCFPTRTFFKRHPEMRIVASHLLPEIEPGLGGRDAAGVSRTLESIRAGGSVFCYLVDLDHIGHLHGPGSHEFSSFLRRLDSWLGLLTHEFLSRNPGGNVFVMSDHGMAPVHRSVELALEDEFGPSRLDRYVYFVDYTMCRVWLSPDTPPAGIPEYLDALPFGRVVTDDERVREGLADRRWGDVIFLLDDTVVFGKTHYGRGVPSGMHGYHPDCESQTAVFGYRGGWEQGILELLDGRILRTRDVYDILCAAADADD